MACLNTSWPKPSRNLQKKGYTTTLDTATRIAVYLIKEITPIKSNVIAALIVILLVSGVAFTEGWSLLWPAFGVANQLIATIVLLVVSLWLINKKAHFIVTLVPGFLMLVITVTALLYQLFRAIQVENYIIMITMIVLILITVSIIAEIVMRLFRPVQSSSGGN